MSTVPCMVPQLAAELGVLRKRPQARTEASLME